MDVSPPDRSEPPGARRKASDATQQCAMAAVSGAGDRFGELYERLAPALHAWATLRIGPAHRGRLDPEDVVQEVWWRAMDAFATYDPEKGVFRAWIFQIANRVLLNGFRSLYVRGHAGDAGRPFEAAVPEHLVGEATSISERAARNEATLRLLREVDTLEPQERALFAYCGLEELPAAAAGRLLGISEAAAAKRWQRLRERLRHALGDSAVGP
jgi:RNA polymerase sigma-70 factor, ECF subfamily